MVSIRWLISNSHVCIWRKNYAKMWKLQSVYYIHSKFNIRWHLGKVISQLTLKMVSDGCHVQCLSAHCLSQNQRGWVACSGSHNYLVHQSPGPVLFSCAPLTVKVVRLSERLVFFESEFLSRAVCVLAVWTWASY